MRESRCLLLAVLLVVVSLCAYMVTRSSPVDRPAPTLVRAFVAFRHGSRAPLSTYANNVYSVDNKTLWPEGAMGLTKKGKMEAYKLGERLRERYGAFLGEYYRPEETRAFANITERTLMSGELVLASLFPPAGIQIWNQELNWQPVPLYPDYIFRSNMTPSCTSFLVGAKESLAEMFANLSPEENEIVSLVMKHSGEPDVKSNVIFGVWDAIFFQDRAGLPIPEWIKEVYPEKISPLIVNILKSSIFGSDTQRKLNLYTNAQGIRDFLLAEDGRKMEIHSLHDLSVMGIMIILGIKIDHVVEPTGCIILEMHQRKEQKFFEPLPILKDEKMESLSVMGIMIILGIKIDHVVEPIGCIILEMHQHKGQKFFEVYYYDSYNSSQPRQLEMSCGLTCSTADLEEMVSHLKIDNYTEVCNDEYFMYKA